MQPKVFKINNVSMLSATIPEEVSVLINLGDTNCIFDHESLFDLESGIVFSTVLENTSWATVELNSELQVLDVYEKSTGAASLEALCGIYWWKRSATFLSLLSLHKDGSELSLLLKESIRYGLYGIRAKQWLDSDHSDYRELASLNLIEARSFNSLSINRFKGTLTKKSVNWEKLIREIEFYEEIPKPLRIYFPRMIDSVKDGPNSYQELEYYPYAPLSNLFVYKRAPIHLWRTILAKLNVLILQEFAAVNDLDNSPDLVGVFVGRVESRLAILRSSDSFPRDLIDSETIVVNKKQYPGVKKILETACGFVAGIPSVNNFMHGDLCLSNILCDLTTLNIKLIDPRGGFDTSTCIGPGIYDIAKLGHSIIGGYDFIISDLFRLGRTSQESHHYSLELFSNPFHLEIETEFYRLFVNSGVTSAELRLLSGLVMLGIPSFHLSHPERAIAIFLRGIELSQSALEELNANLY
jgi:hypothetical protein